MTHLLISKKIDSDSSKDFDYNPEEDPEYQKKSCQKPINQTKFSRYKRKKSKIFD